MRLAPVILAVSLLAGRAGARAQAPSSARAPSLVVLIAVDQFRADYLDRFGAQMHGGIARLMQGGARFTNAHHDHAITETAPGHATLLSGRFPRSTGITMNSIGVFDPAAPLLAGAYGPGASPRRFNGTTLTDWLRAANPRSHTLSVSMKDRAAILPNGRTPGDVYWYSPDGRFSTSRYFRDALPAWVNEFNDRRMAQSYAGRKWMLLLPDTAYAERDSVPVEGGGHSFTFPHALPDDPDDAASLVRATPFMDDLVVAFALHGVQSLQLGAGPQTDLLSISLSATDVIGHGFGPDSREMHDQVLRVDRAVGRLVDSLYKLRDSSRIVIAFTSDHGVGTIPELAPPSVQPRPHRVSPDSVVAGVAAALRAMHVDTMALDIDHGVVVVNREAFRAAGRDPDSLLMALAASARRVPGVARVDRFSALLRDTLTDVVARRWAHQFPAAAPIELIVTLTPLSTWGGNVASHGSVYDYDSGVPLIFYGMGVRTGRSTAFVRTVDLAPTLAALAGVTPTERIDGVVLRDAIR